MCSRILFLGWMLSWFAPVYAQPVITAENIQQLQSVQHIDFDDLPAAAGTIRNGQFFTNADGSLLAVVNQTGQIIILDDEGQSLTVTDVILTDDDFPATFIDGAFGDAGFVAVHTTGNGFVVTVVDWVGNGDLLTITTDDKPVAIWSTEDAIWLEVIPDEPAAPPYLARLNDGELTVMPYVPAQVENMVVRIGRLAPPLAVTVTDAGEVQRWNLETGALTGQAMTDDIPIYGHMQHGSDHMVWRDPASRALHILNFATGDDRIVADLGGLYIPFLFISEQAGVILGVNVDDQPMVNAWITASGERLPLGLYRQCNRPPDMVKLTRDNTTLIIGCDTGLDIWRGQG